MPEEVKESNQKVEETQKTYTVEEYSTLETKYKALETQLAEANKTIQGYKDMDIDSIKKSVKDYKTKYEQSEADRKAFEHKTKVSAYVRGLNLKDDIYENYITNELISKGLQFDGDKLIGGDDVVSAFKTTHPDAFKPSPSERVASPTNQGTPTTMSGVEQAFLKRNPNLKF